MAPLVYRVLNHVSHHNLYQAEMSRVVIREPKVPCARAIDYSSAACGHLPHPRAMDSIFTGYHFAPLIGSAQCWPNTITSFGLSHLRCTSKHSSEDKPPRHLFDIFFWAQIVENTFWWFRPFSSPAQVPWVLAGEEVGRRSF